MNIDNIMHRNLKTTEDLAEVLCSIPNGKLGVFFGAGVSRNAGLPLANELKNEILNVMEMSEYQNALSHIPFEQFMEFVIGFSNENNDILEIFNQGNPTLFHELMAHCIKNGKIKNILTTNFDMLLEKACIDKNVNICRLCNEQEFNLKDITTPCYIKIHGSIDDISSTRIILSDITKNENIESRNRVLNYFFNDTNEEIVIILGYSCSDVFDILPFMKSNNNDFSKKIIFIEHCNYSNNNIYVLKNKNPLKKFSGVRIRCNTNNLIIDWYKKEMNYEKPLTIESTSWKEYCSHLPVYLENKNKLVVGALLQHRRLFELSTNLFREILEEEQFKWSGNMKVSIYNTISFNLYNLFKMRKYKNIYIENKYQYLECAENVIKTEKIDWIHCKTTYAKYAAMLILDRRYKEAVVKLEQAKSIIITDNQTSLNLMFKDAALQGIIGDSYYSLYTVTKNKDYLNCAHEHYYKSFDFFSKKGGYMIEKEISYYNMARIYIKEGIMNKEVEDYIKVSHEIARNIGDVVGVRKCSYLRRLIHKLEISGETHS